MTTKRPSNRARSGSTESWDSGRDAPISKNWSQREEDQRIAADPKYRTPARTLKRLAAGHVFYDLPGTEVGAWDRFSTRNIGLRVNQRMASDLAEMPAKCASIQGAR